MPRNTERWENVIPVVREGQGHYRLSFRVQLVNAQAAGSRLFELRNQSPLNFVIPTQIKARWMQTGAHTAALEAALDLFKVRDFRGLDNVNAVTLTPSVKRLDMEPATSPKGFAAVRILTSAGAAAGMTGGNIQQKDPAPLCKFPKWMHATQPTAGEVTSEVDMVNDGKDSYPLVLRRGEGIVIENSNLLGAAAASAIYFDVAWAEMVDY